MNVRSLACLTSMGLLMTACAPEEPATEVVEVAPPEAMVVVNGRVEGPQTIATASLPFGSGWLIQPAYAQVQWQPLADVPVALRLTDEAGQLAAAALATTMSTSDGTFALELPTGYEPSPNLVLVAGDGIYTAVEPTGTDWVLRRLVTGTTEQVINPATELVYERVAETLDQEDLDLRLLPVTELDRYYVTVHQEAQQYDWAQHRDLLQSIREFKRRVADQPDVIEIHQQVARPAHRSEAAGGEKPLPPQAVGPDGVPPGHRDRPAGDLDRERWDDHEAADRPGPPPHAGGGDRPGMHDDDHRPGAHVDGDDHPGMRDEQNRPGPPPHASGGHDGAGASPGQAGRPNDDSRSSDDRGNRGGNADSAGAANNANQGKGRGRN